MKSILCEAEIELCYCSQKLLVLADCSIGMTLIREITLFAVYIGHFDVQKRWTVPTECVHTFHMLLRISASRFPQTE